MSKELEALQRLRNKNCKYLSLSMDREVCEDFKIIENTLKRLEMEHTLRIMFENANYKLVREKQDTKKKLKALEIIKKKRVNVEWLLESESVDEYNESLYNDLTQEEYDLLTEVLL